ncbi:hypothetical protein VKT23_001411 [Stygiomarasmius scandens]|uniref:Uncharacterized protein n=1 Tax=Marasmiellus scandens TaxID=2682957 RepID=A0ABR1JZ60_9AGAR
MSKSGITSPEVNASRDKMAEIVASALRSYDQQDIARIMSAYTDDHIFSLDLIGAVIRQNTFVTKMYDLGWTNPTFFDGKESENETVLYHAIARYHAFLDLINANPESFFVPTLDIDLAWHTHQLMSNKYKNDCMKLIGKFIDHDDKVEEGKLSKSFDETCRAWKDRFGIRYAHCGCPIPGNTIGQKLSRLTRILTSEPQTSTNSSSPVYPGTDTPPEGAWHATHPSDHNACPTDSNKLLKRTASFIKKGSLEKSNAAADSPGHGPAFVAIPPSDYRYEPGDKYLANTQRDRDLAEKKKKEEQARLEKEKKKAQEEQRKAIEKIRTKPRTAAATKRSRNSNSASTGYSNSYLTPIAYSSVCSSTCN